MGSLTRINIAYKIIIGCLIGVLLIGGFWIFVHRYFEVVSDMSQVANRNPVTQKAIDLAKLDKDYLAKSSAILTAYLAAATTSDPNLIGLSRNAQSDLLNLTLPAQYREEHLAKVLLLGEIVEMSKAGNLRSAARKINDLKELTIQK